MPSAKKKAVVICRFPFESSWGGEEHHTIVLARFLKEKGLEPVYMGSCPILLERFRKENFPVLELWAGKMIVTAWEAFKSLFLFVVMKAQLKKGFQQLMEQYDIKGLYCLSLNEKLFLTPLAQREGIPVTWVEHQEIRGWLLKSPWKKRYLRLSKAVQIVPISQKNERTLKRMGVPITSMTEIVNGVDFKSFQKGERKTQKGLVVAANRMIPKKGLMDFLEAIKIVTQQEKNIKVVLLGEGEERGQLERYAKEQLGQADITINNFLKKEKWIELLKKADVYVSCARDSNETFSLNTAEALASGVVVVVTSCSGIADYLKPKKEAFVAKPQDPKDLSGQIQQALKAPEGFRQQGERIAEERFNQDRMLQQYYDLIIRKS